MGDRTDLANSNPSNRVSSLIQTYYLDGDRDRETDCSSSNPPKLKRNESLYRELFTSLVFSAMR